MQLHARTRLGTLIPATCLFLSVVLVGCSGPVSFQTYTGNGYHIAYPQDWTLSTREPVTVFSSQDNSSWFFVEVDDNPRGYSPDSVIASATQNANVNNAHLINVRQHQTNATAQFGGETWLQRAFDGTNAQGVTITIVYLLANHQTNSPIKAYFIGFAAPANNFDQANADSFQPMLKSFAFTS